MTEIVVVSVTYGRRWHLLRAVLDSAKSEGATKAIVIDNASKEDIRRLADEKFGDWCRVVTLNQNTGSAGGFKKGIEEAIGSGADYVLLLDDDNVLGEGCLSALVRAWQDVRREGEIVAVYGIRWDHGSGGLRKKMAGFAPRLKNSFVGFHIGDLAKKIRRRLPGAFPVINRADLPLVIPMTKAPYGGLFFHRSLINQIGLPNEAYVLYQDDFDFTYRITQQGGRLFVVRDAVILDIEASWTGEYDPFGSAFSAWLRQGSDFRVYYTLRNTVYWDKVGRRQNSPVFWLNCALYLSILTLYAVRYGRLGRYRILMRAFTDGWQGKLGINPRFPLP